MGKFDFDISDALYRQLNNAEDIDRIAKKILDDAAPMVEEALKAECSKHVRTSEMVNSIKIKKANLNKYGYFVSVRPTGKDAKGVRNMQKMAHAEYGTSKQAPTPIITRAINNCRGAVLDKLESSFKKELE